ncbi:MAG: hypothetical protein KDD22_00150, partial [Bdellovibrionales bacterium]|nr:hypothetical protein [Bdellovibrionales bacterium]
MPWKFIKSDIWILNVIHWSLIFVIPAVVALPTSCIVKPMLKSADLGQEVSQDDINSANLDALDGVNPYKAKLGEIVRHLITIKIETNLPETVGVHTQEVIHLCNGPDWYILSYEDTKESKTTEDPPVVKEEHWEFNKLSCKTGESCNLPPACEATLSSQQV